MKVVIFIFFSVFINGVFCQNISYIVSTSGEELRSATKIINFTLGEVTIDEISSSNQILTQGFHQPIVDNTVSTKQLNTLKKEINIFPNPTDSEIILEFETIDKVELSVSIYSVLGIQYLETTIQPSEYVKNINLENLPSGILILKIQDPINGEFKSFEIIKEKP